MNCPKCKTEIPKNAKFCLECGSNVSAISVQSGVEAEPSLGEFRTMQGRVPDAPGDLSLGGMRTMQGGGASAPDADVSLGEMRTMAGIGGGAGSRSAATAGTPLGERYELGEEIGRGGFARVWRATDRKLGRTVAVKRLLAGMLQGASGEQTLARFRREAQAIAQLNHRNIVAVYDHDHDDEGDYIVMELVDGGTLRDYLKAKGGKLELDAALPLIRGIAQGLGAAHKKNLVHRDIKPGNILLHKEGDDITPKIVDFGLARAGSDSELSMSGYGMGTPYYMPPEQRRDAKNVNHTADIYALGKVFYELVTGDVPDNVDPEKIPPVRGLSDIIFKCIKSNPGERYFSADEIIAALDGVGGVAKRAAVSAGGENPCPSCGAANKEDVKFCEACGSGLTRLCPECSRENSVHKQFCGGCGTDVDCFLQLQEALPRLEKYAAEKRWSRVVKEHGLLPKDAKMAGRKGRSLRGKSDSLKAEADAKLLERERLAHEIEQYRSRDKLGEALAAVQKYMDIDPHSDEIKALAETLPVEIDRVAAEQAVQAASQASANGDFEAGLAACAQYLEQYAAGAYSATINQWVAKLKAGIEQRAAEQAVHAASQASENGDFEAGLAACTQYLEQFTAGAYAEAVTQWAQRLEMQIDQRSAEGTVESASQEADKADFKAGIAICQRYLKQQGDSPNAETVREWEIYLQGFADLDGERLAVMRAADFDAADAILARMSDAGLPEAAKTVIGQQIAKERAECAGLEASARCLHAEKRIEEATEAWEALSQLYPESKDFKKRFNGLWNTREQLQIMLREAKAQIKDNSWFQLLRTRALLLQILAISPQQPNALTWLSDLECRVLKIRKLIKVGIAACVVALVTLVGIRQIIHRANQQIISTASSLASQGQYTEALTLHGTCRRAPWLLLWVPRRPGEWVERAEAQVQMALSDAKTAKARENWKEVIRAANRVLALQPSHVDALSIKQEAMFRLIGSIADLGLDLMPVGAGSFQMGSNDGSVDEKPVRTVRITRDFWMGKTEVTQKQYQQLMGRNPSHFKGEDLPVEMVSWNDAIKFCEELTKRERAANRLPSGYVYRLPTEAEWEYAARGGAQGRSTAYAGSDNLDSVAWHSGNSGSKTQRVGTKAANELGLHDMSGNVWEWCHDWYQNSYNGLGTTDPSGPSSGSYRVNRGGSWSITAARCRVASRNYRTPSSTNSNLGFRVVLASPVQ